MFVLFKRKAHAEVQKHFLYNLCISNIVFERFLMLHVCEEHA